MDSLTIIIRLTGLLLFSNATPTNGPMHVLFPVAPAGMERHIAQLGFWQANDVGCADWVTGICYVRIDNSTLQFGRPGNSLHNALPPGNASRATGANVEKRYLQEALSDVPSLHARVTLHEGRMDGSCALGRFRLRQGSADQLVDLANVVRWTYRVPLQDGITITRQRVRAADANAPRDSTWTVKRDRTNAVELFVRYIPQSLLHDPGTPDDLEAGEELKHFGAFYQLLESAPSGPLPVLVGPAYGGLCPWSGQGVAWTGPSLLSRRMRIGRGIQGARAQPFDQVGTLSCPVGAGLPAQ